MKPARPAGRPSGYGGGERREGGAYKAPRGDREYRRRDDAGDKEGASGEFRPVSLVYQGQGINADEYQKFGGVGRGAGAPPS